MLLLYRYKWGELMEKNESEKENDSLTLYDWVKSIVIALILAMFIRTFIASATSISGSSMNNTLQDRDIVLINKMVNMDNLERGDIVVFKAPNTVEKEEKDYIKRVIGLPGEKIDILNGNIYIDGTEFEEDYINSDYTSSYEQIGKHWVVGEDEVFVLGDNRLPGKSSDSRIFGPIKKDSIIGTAFFRIYPLSSIGVLE